MFRYPTPRGAEHWPICRALQPKRAPLVSLWAIVCSPLPPAPKVELDEPDRNPTIPSAVRVEGPSDDFVCCTLDPDVTENVWLTGTQVTAGNSEIVHHALVFLDRAGQGQQLADENGQYKCFGSPKLNDTALIAAWAAGAVPARLPARTGIPLKPGDRLVVQVHYHPTGKGPETDDATRISLKWTTAEPEYIGAILLISRSIWPRRHQTIRRRSGVRGLSAPSGVSSGEHQTIHHSAQHGSDDRCEPEQPQLRQGRCLCKQRNSRAPRGIDRGVGHRDAN